MSAGRRRRPGRFLTVLLLAAACSDAPGGGTGTSGAAEAAPDLAAVTLAGDTVSLASLRGAPVLLNLWATWCPPCREEMPSLQRVHEDYRDRGLRVVAISSDGADAGAAIREFIGQHGISFTILHDPDDRASAAFRTFGLPETFLIDAQGRLVRRWRGKVDGDSPAFREALEAVLERPAGARGRAPAARDSA